MRIRFLVSPLIVLTFLGSSVQTAKCQITKFKKPKKEPAYGLISKGDTFYKYFTTYAEQNVYRFDQFGRPIIARTKREKEKERKEMVEQAKLRQKSRQTGLSPDFLKTKDETVDAKKITKSDEKKAIERLKRVGFRKPVKIKKAIPKKPAKKTRKIIGPYEEYTPEQVLTEKKPAEETDEEKTEASFFLD
jgi:hypothetical protein